MISIHNQSPHMFVLTVHPEFVGDCAPLQPTPITRSTDVYGRDGELRGVKTEQRLIPTSLTIHPYGYVDGLPNALEAHPAVRRGVQLGTLRVVRH